ncbi:MAG: hypothetical protein ACKO7B_05720, partial [Flavobacteriales bacterium]
VIFSSDIHQSGSTICHSSMWLNLKTMGPTLFANRMDAAEQLIPMLREFVHDHTVVLAITRGAIQCIALPKTHHTQ